MVSGAGGWFDGARLLADTRRICEAQIGFWHGTGGEAPFKSYLFMMHASGEGYGGLEHRNSTALICQRTDLPKLLVKDEKPPALKATDGYTTLLGLISMNISTPGTSSACARPSSSVTTTTRKTTPSCSGSSKASPATTTT
ncbi:hypothetical protein Y695_04331 [Hydrogenophaga sp. T4]|nr:hypothetical protein Y695_04331 [Hydrogenophaga sp. T4]